MNTTEELKALIKATGHHPYPFQGHEYCVGCGDGYMRREPWEKCPVRKLAEASLAALAYERTQTQAMKNYGDAAVIKLNKTRFAARDAKKAREAEEASDQWLRDIIAQAKDRIGTAAFGGGPYGPTVSLVRSVYDILDDPRLKYYQPSENTPEESA